MKSNELLLDAFGRIRETVAATLEGVDDDVLVRRPAGTGNSIAWLIWHLGRVEDAQVASAAGLEQVWTSQGFVGRFDLPLSEARYRVRPFQRAGRFGEGPAGAAAGILRRRSPADRGLPGRPSATRTWTASSTPAGTRLSPSECGWSARLPTASSTWGRPRTPRA